MKHDSTVHQPYNHIDLDLCSKVVGCSNGGLFFVMLFFYYSYGEMNEKKEKRRGPSILNILEISNQTLSLRFTQNTETTLITNTLLKFQIFINF